jgi:hypothetical protein
MLAQVVFTVNRVFDSKLESAVANYFGKRNITSVSNGVFAVLTKLVDKDYEFLKTTFGDQNYFVVVFDGKEEDFGGEDYSNYQRIRIMKFGDFLPKDKE